MYWSPVFIPSVDWSLKHLLYKLSPAQISNSQLPIALFVYIRSKEALQWMPVHLFFRWLVKGTAAMPSPKLINTLAVKQISTDISA